MHRFFSLPVLACFLLPALISGCNPSEKGQSKAAYNFVLIYTDELQFSDLGCYGGAFPSPYIDQLAREGMLFRSAYVAASMCTPSRYSVLTGQFPGRCSAPSFMEENPVEDPCNIAWNSWITGDKETLARVLGRNGYVTGMAGKWHVGRIPDHVVQPGFDPGDDPAEPEVQLKLEEQQRIYQRMVREQAGFDYAYSVVWSNYDGHPVEALQFHNFPWMTGGAVRFLEEQRNSRSPFFLYFTPTAIHGPNHVKDLERDVTLTPEGRDPEILRYQLDVDAIKAGMEDVPGGQKHRYAGIAQTDHAVGVILKKLEELGMADRTVVVFISDHNIEPGKATSYEKGIHVPMIVRVPGITSGQATGALVQNIDIYPTLLEAAAIALPEEYTLDGQSFWDVLEDPRSDGRKHVFSENGYTRSVSDGKFKYIALRYPRNMVEQMEQGKLDHVPSYVGAWPQAHSAIAMNCYPNYFDQDQLYNLEKDPYELNNLFATMIGSEELVRLKQALGDHLSGFAHPFPLDPVPFLETPAYDDLVKKNLSYDLSAIPWLSRDHGMIRWPPEGR